MKERASHFIYNFLYKSIFACVALFSFMSLSAQEMGKWKTYLSYSQVSEVLLTKEKVYALSDGALFSVDVEYESVQTYTKVEGLSDGEIVHLGYNEELDKLVIVYANGNIDLLEGDQISNISDLKRKEINGKNVHSIVCHGKYAYLSCGLGIVVVDVKKEEIADTYIIGENGGFLATYKVEIVGDSIYAHTESGVLSAYSKDPNLSNYEKWTKRVFTKDAVKTIARRGDHLVVVVPDSVLEIQGDGVKKIHENEGFGFISSSDKSMTIWDNDTIYTYMAGDGGVEKFYLPYCRAGVRSDISGDYWLACSPSHVENGYGNYNLYKFNKKGESQNRFTPNGPINSSPGFMKFDQGILILGSGGPFDLPGVHVQGVLQIYENGEWTILRSQDFAQKNIFHPNSFCNFENVLDAVVDPNDPRRIYIASWQSLFELYDKKPVIQYWTENSTLANITQQILVDGLCFDKEGNLWMGNMLSETAVNVKKTDGTWGAYSYPELVNKATLKETFVSSNGFLWFLAPRVGAGVAVIDQRGTPFISSDDKFEFFGSLKDEDGNTVTPSSFRSIAEDKDGAIWIGTSSGPFIVSAPDRIFDSDFRFKRIKITREDNENYADYLLGSDQINAIVVDAGNRKWIGSATSGLYLLSPDGKETLMRFNTDNSPLTSNAIVDLAMNHETGELFVATSAGVFSYMTDASEAQETYNNVTVYPNPVTPDYDGDVVVRGLMENSIVRIADAEGQAVYEGYSNGGTFVWDGRNFNQQRVATGVYFIFATVDDGSQKMVAKVAFVR